MASGAAVAGAAPLVRAVIGGGAMVPTLAMATDTPYYFAPGGSSQIHASDSAVDVHLSLQDLFMVMYCILGFLAGVVMVLCWHMGCPWCRVCTRMCSRGSKLSLNRLELDP